MNAGELGVGITGVVVDKSDAPVPGAQVTIRNAQGTVLRQAATGLDGTFSIPGIPPGSYGLSVEARHFDSRQLMLPVNNATPAPLRIQLDVAAIRSMITVVANRGAVEDVDAVGQMVTVRDRQHLERPLPTLGNALEDAPGVAVQQTTYGQVSPILRGLTGYQTLLLVDGVRFNTSIFRSGPNQYLAFLEPAHVERVEAILGPAGAAFGSDSMGGTVNVITATPQFGDSHSLELHGDAGISGNTADASGAACARAMISTKRIALTLGASGHRVNDLRAGRGEDSRNVFRRYTGLDAGQIWNLLGSRLQDTGFSQMALDGALAVRMPSDQAVTLRFMRSDLAGVRSYRDQLGGQGRLQSEVSPQTLNFGYARYERLQAGPLDSLSGTFSLNSQRDGSVLQTRRFTDPITTDYSRVNSYGYTVQGTDHIGSRSTLVFGGEVYDERIRSTRFVLDPTTQRTVQQRALYPDGSRYRTSGLYIQDSLELSRGRLRAVLGARLTGVQFSARATQNRDGQSQDLGVIDASRTFRDLTFNSSLLWQVTRMFGLNVLIGRGFRAPNLTDLGAIGLRTLGYDVPTEDAIAAGALLGADSGDGALFTGRGVQPLGPESLWNYEIGFRITSRRLHFRQQVFDAELLNPISGRTLLFPVNRVPAAIAGVPVSPLGPSAAQLSQGVVAVATPLTPRSVKSTINDGHSRYYGLESSVRYNVSSRWQMEGTYSFLAGRDLNPNRPARRLPPQAAFAAVRFTPSGRLWFEWATRLVGAQERLNGGDIDDDRIGASRRRSDIADFFRSGVVSPYVRAGSDDRIGTADDIFGPKGETLRQIQDRVLPVGATINGVRVTGDGSIVPLYLRTDGWWSTDIRGGLLFTERLHAQFGVTNLLDRNYRVHGSGVDGPGVSVYLGFRFAF